MENKDLAILIVDDERPHADGMAEALEKYCSDPIVVYNAKDALDVIKNQYVDVIITDLKLDDDKNGLDILKEAKKKPENPEVILVTAYASIDNCKQALKEGAYDYLVKPIDIDQLRTIVERVSKKTEIQREKEAKAKDTSSEEFIFRGVKGKSQAIENVFKVIKRVAKTNISVLIEGESGTGKELLARSIHENSNRVGQPFKPINCAGLTESLLESELFGHAKGAFTGATTDRKGLFEIADKGTLFLDEIGDMPLKMQAKLLRVLEDGIVVPVGSNKSVVVDVRVISATNHDLAKMVEQDKFRQDLFFRIKGVSVTLPPLRQRVEDIPLFVEYFISESAEEIGSQVKGITDPAMNILKNYSWPGNIRQLKNCIRTMIVMSENEKLSVEDIPPEIHQPLRLSGSSKQITSGDIGKMSLSEIEKQAIIETLAKTDNNREKAAKILGIGERTLYRKIKEYGL